MKVVSILSQVLKLFSGGGFEKAVKEHKAERHARGFTSWGQFMAMLICQLGRAHSLREICGGLACCEGQLKHLGVPVAPKKSTLAYCASRILGGVRVLCFVKRMQRSSSAAGIGQPVGLAGVADGRTHRQPASQRVILRFHCNRTRHTPCRPVITLPDVRTDDEVRQLAAARPPAQGPAVAPTDSPACPFPATGASESRDSTARTTSCVCATTPR